MKIIINIDVPELASGIAFYTAALRRNSTYGD